MKLTIKFILALFTLLFYTNSFSQKPLELKNSNLEGVSPEGKFWWWKNDAKNGADATFSVEDFDTNPGSQRSLKVETHRLGDKGWFLELNAPADRHACRFHGDCSSSSRTENWRFVSGDTESQEYPRMASLAGILI